MKILVTGTAGFIGFFTAKRLLELGNEVVGLDNINNYYDVNLKYRRLLEAGFKQEEIEYNVPIQSRVYEKYKFIKLNLEDRDNLQKIFDSEKFDKVCNLAAQPGVRYSIENPYSYIDSNIVGFINLLECVRHHKIQHMVFASSSSIYGNNYKLPFSEDDQVDKPLSLYAATKKANELMAYTYSHLYNISLTGLRFFTVYGPWGRPDMAPMIFAKAIFNNEPIKIFNKGNLMRDFTYIDDIVEGITRIIEKNTTGTPPYKIYNIGSSNPVKLMDFIEVIESFIGKKADKIFMEMQPGDVYQTYADTSKLEHDFGFRATTSLQEGIKTFVEWYLDRS